MNKKVLTKMEFKNYFMNPLEKRFGFKSYWNGKDLELIDISPIQGNYYGMSYTMRLDAPIALRYRKNNLDMLRTLIHEYAHSFLHRKGVYGYELSKHMKEVEAETVAKNVFKILDLEYQNEWYIPKYLKRSTEDELKEFKSNKRQNLIKKLSRDISDTLYANIGLIMDLNAKNEYKYKVSCECCENIWYYKNESKIIKNKAEGYWCRSCGKNKSINRLRIEKL